MKRKKVIDTIIGVFLISTLGLAAFIVSCSDQNSIIPSFNSYQGTPYHQQIHGQRSLHYREVSKT